MENKLFIFQPKAIVLFVLVALFLLPFLENFKLFYNIFEPNGLGFDSQNILAWRYASKIEMFPYRDVFFPYGIIYFFKDVYLFSFLPLLLGLGYYIVIRKIVKNDNWVLISFLIFFLSAFFVSGIAAFVRYGIFQLAVLIIALNWFSKKEYLSKKVLIGIGLACGVIFSLFLDQGIYFFVVVLFFIVINPILKLQAKSLNTKYIKNTFTSLIFLFLGIALGIIPFFIFLSYNGALSSFLVSILELKYIFYYAKTPYLHSLRSWEGGLNILALFIASYYIGYKFIFKRNRLFELDYEILVVFVSLLLLLQKSITRSMDKQLVFIGILLLLFIFHAINKELKIEIKRRYSNILKHLVYIMAILLIFSLISSVIPKKYLKQEITKTYAQVRNKIGNEKIFSFPGDPLFYILFQQAPPYYFTIYEASPEQYQKKRIKYINENKVNYIIYNLDIKSIQDGVPDLVRGNTEVNYILSNFHIVDLVENFLIFKINKSNEDFFNNSFLQKYPQIYSYFSIVNLGHIPKSEGIYKKRIIDEEGHKLYETKSILELNKFIENQELNSKNLFFIFTPDTRYNKDMHIGLKTKDKHIADIYFQPCDIGMACIINLSHIPIFYRNRIVEEFIMNSNFRGKIEIITGVKNAAIW